MRHFIFILLACITFLSQAQNLSQAEMNKAQNCATEFCNLLQRFSNGERTLNTQINALCSGADCSAFDDIKANKEVTLRNYLMAIQQKYPKKLAMQITPPSLAESKTYIEPSIKLDIVWGSTGNTPEFGAETAEMSVEGVQNVYIVFDVVQKYPTLNVSKKKKIIYDTNIGKITAFITNDGPYISFLNGTLAFANKDYNAAISYFDKAASNDRFPLRKDCYGLAMLCAIYLNDMNKVIHYAVKTDNRVYLDFMKLQQCIENDQYNEAYTYLSELERLVVERDDLTIMTKRNIYTAMALCYVIPSTTYQDLDKAKNYLLKAVELGDLKAAYTAYSLYNVIEDDFIGADVALDCLQKAAQGGYPPAFYPWGQLLESVTEDREQVLNWYEKSAQSGNPVGMANAGKLLIDKREKAKGVKWLKKSLEGQNLEAQLEEYETSNIPAPWPKSRADVKKLLDESSASNYSSSNTGTSYSHTTISQTSGNSSHLSTSGSSYYSSGNYYSSSSDYSYHTHKFNEAKVHNFVGLSAGYVQKQWVYDYGEHTENIDIFGEDKFTNGIQCGLRIDPQLGYGFGIGTGLFYEYYFDRSEDMVEDGIDYYLRTTEHSLYLPIHLKYSLNFSKWFQLAFYGGVGLDYGLSGKIHIYQDGESSESFSMYDDEFDIKRFNTSLEYGASLRINNVQFNYTISKGLIDMSGNDEYKVKQNKPCSVSMSIYF